MDFNENNDSYQSTNDVPKPNKDKILGLSKRLDDGSIATGWKILLTDFGYHAVNAVSISLLMLLVAFNFSEAISGQVEEVSFIIKTFSIFAFLFAFWSILHQRIFSSLLYYAGLLIVYFICLQTLSNSMYGSLAQLAILCLFQFAFLSLVVPLVIKITVKKELRLISYLS
ncbi:TPA: hypothetical protein ACGIK9_002862 [Acinetobacter baumannii]|uniref:hypothetical protein n=1 Tax=Acinetobacter baumannii TaxID=470 RepID=UPI00338E9963